MSGTRGGKREGAGRPEGSKSKRTREIEEIIAESGHDPVTAAINIARDQVPCSNCSPDRIEKGTGQIDAYQFNVYCGETDKAVLTKAKRSRTKFACPMCNGTGYAIIEMKVRSDANKTLLPFIYPKLSSKSVDKSTKVTHVTRLGAFFDQEQTAAKVNAMQAKMDEKQREAEQKKIDEQKDNGKKK